MIRHLACDDMPLLRQRRFCGTIPDKDCLRRVLQRFDRFRQFKNAFLSDQPADIDSQTLIERESESFSDFLFRLLILLKAAELYADWQNRAVKARKLFGFFLSLWLTAKTTDAEPTARLKALNAPLL